MRQPVRRNLFWGLLAISALPLSNKRPAVMNDGRPGSAMRFTMNRTYGSLLPGSAGSKTKDFRPLSGV